MQLKGARDPSSILEVRRLGPLPILNSFLSRLEVDRLLSEAVPTTDARCVLEHNKALGVLLRTIVVEREPIYVATGQDEPPFHRNHRTPGPLRLQGVWGL